MMRRRCRGKRVVSLALRRHRFYLKSIEKKPRIFYSTRIYHNLGTEQERSIHDRWFAELLGITVRDLLCGNFTRDDIENAHRLMIDMRRVERPKR